MPEKYSKNIISQMLIEIKEYIKDIDIEVINNKCIIKECYAIIRKYGIDNNLK